SHHDHVGDRALRAAFAERAIREPQLADDFSNGEVAIETLPACRTERALERAAGLRGDTKCAARGLGYEHGLDRVIGPDVEQPFARTVGGSRITAHRRRDYRRHLSQPLPEYLGDVGHRRKVFGARLMDPMQELLRAIR